MTSRAFRVVEMFEEAMAEYAGAKYGVAMDSCSTAIFLSLVWSRIEGEKISTPKKTYISVPRGIVRAGGIIEWLDEDWQGAYRLGGTEVVDSALRMRRGMFREWPLSSLLYCVSFHMRKHIKIGRGGMVLTDNAVAADWLKRMRFDGRTGSIPFMEDPVEDPGFNAYMLPEQAARGLQLLEALPDDPPDLTPAYPDLSKLPVFKS